MTEISSKSSTGTTTTSQQTKCRFNDCDSLAVDGTSKCAFHKNRRQCCVENCTNQVYARKLCVRHGGKKQCQYENCEAHARGGGYCLQHGGFVVKRFCIVEGCSKQAHARQKCVRHGGGRRCKVDGCRQHARAGGLCNRHSHGHSCRIEGCNKTAQHSGSICFHHAMELRAHGEAVPELNIAKGGRISTKKRQQMQEQEQMKQPQLFQPINYNPHQQLHHPHGVMTASAGAQSPLGLPLKINLPTGMPKFNMRNPLSGFPTPRTQEFSMLMGLPSPSIDNSQLPSFMTMNRSMYDNYGVLQGVHRSATRNPQNYFTVGVHPPHQEEDLDVIINNYSKFINTEAASPIAFNHNVNQYAPPILENIGLNVFVNNSNNQSHKPGNFNQGYQLQRLKMDYSVPNPTTLNSYQDFSTSSHGDVYPDYTTQFFAEANKSTSAPSAPRTPKVSA